MNNVLLAFAIFFGGVFAMSFYAYFFPIISKGSGITTNSIWTIHIADYEKCPGAVLAQELYEFRRRLRRLIVFSFFGQREMELTSHAIECWAAWVIYGADPVQYAETEAVGMNDFYPWLKGMTEDQIRSEMIRRSGLPAVHDFVESNRRLLTKWK